MDQLERFKSEINLTEYAASRGYRLDRGESSQNSVVMRHPISDDKIIVSRAQADRHWIYFSVRDDRDHGTIIDFVQRRGGGTLADVRLELYSWIGDFRPPVPVDLYAPVVKARTIDRARVAREFERARAATNSAYLNERGLRPEMLRDERFAGCFREDARGNVLFPHFDAGGLSGYESKNRGWTSFSPGGAKALWRSRSLSVDRRLVLVESAIDALSFHQAQPDPRTSYVSTAGSLSPHQRELLKETLAILPGGTLVVLAFDRDAGGERLAQQVRELGARDVSRSVSPIGKDWNDYVRQRERTYILSLARRREPSREL